MATATRNEFGVPILYPLAISFSGSGDNVIVPAISGAILELYQLTLVVGGACNLTFKDGVGGNALSGPYPMIANMSIVLDFSGAAWYASALGNSLVINTNNAVQVSGTAYYMVK